MTLGISVSGLGFLKLLQAGNVRNRGGSSEETRSQGAKPVYIRIYWIGEKRSRGNPRDVELLKIRDVVLLKSNKRVPEFSGEKAVAGSVAPQIGHKGDQVIIKVFCRENKAAPRGVLVWIGVFHPGKNCWLLTGVY